MKKSSIFKNLIDGAKSILVLIYRDEYIYPDKQSFNKDRHHLSSDVKSIGRSMKKVISEYHG